MLDKITNIFPFFITVVLIAVIINVVYFYIRAKIYPPKSVYKKAAKEIGCNKPFRVERVDGKWRATQIEETEE